MAGRGRLKPAQDDRAAHRAELEADLRDGVGLRDPGIPEGVPIAGRRGVGVALGETISHLVPKDAIDDRPGFAVELQALIDRRGAPAAIGVFTAGQPPETDDRHPVMIPLDRLLADPDNARRTGRKTPVAELAADIAARGVLQNLGVVPAPDRPGHWLVKFGERRRRALRLLVTEGRIAADYPVPCRVLDMADHADEASLAENLHRVALNPADEIAAYARFVAGGATPAEIAERFGHTVRHVEGRLRLAGCAACVLDGVRDGSISLASAQAYASVADPDRQAAVWKEKHMRNSPDHIRREMRRSGVEPGDRRAVLIGRAAYLAAGGRIEADLFSDAASELWLDVALIDRLAGEALHAGAVALQARFGFGKMLITTKPSGAPAEADVDGLTMYGPAVDFTQLSEGARSQLAVVAMVRTDGTVGLYRNAWVISGDMIVMPDAARMPVRPVPPVDDDARDFPISRSADDGSPVVPPAAAANVPPEPASAEPATLSQRLLDELAMQRRDVLRLCLADSYAVAGDFAAFVIADTMVPSKRYRVPYGSRLHVGLRQDPVSGAVAWEDGDTARHLEDQFGSLPGDWATEDDLVRRFAAFRALTTEQKLAWCAWGTAATLTAWAENFNRSPAPLHDVLAGLIAVKPAKYWRPTGPNYFDRVPIAALHAMIGDCGLPDPAAKDAPWAKMKRADLAAACAALAEGDTSLLGAGGLGETRLRAAARAGEVWLPVQMRFGETGK